jgi:hypothetical protein
VPDGSIDALPISKRMKNLIRGIDDPEHPYDSRSERVIAVLVAMAAAGCADEQLAATMLDQPIGEHVREQPKPEEYLERQIAQARKIAADPDVAKLNETYALVLVSDTATILKTVGTEFSFLTISALKEWLGNRFVHRSDKHIPLAQHWLRHPQRPLCSLTLVPARTAAIRGASSGQHLAHVYCKGPGKREH